MLIIIINVMRIISNFCIKNVTIKQEIIEYISEQVPNTHKHTFPETWNWKSPRKWSIIYCLTTREKYQRFSVPQ